MVISPYPLRDLELPVAGIPIVINRNYDSRNKDKGDFGIGWTLGIQDIKISSNYPLGKYWKFETSSGPLGLPNYHLVESKKHVITVTYSDGRTDEFYVKCSPDSQVLTQLVQTTVSFVPKMEHIQS